MYLQQIIESALFRLFVEKISLFAEYFSPGGLEYVLLHRI
jgi:hypothetical protein